MIDLVLKCSANGTVILKVNVLRGDFVRERVAASPSSFVRTQQDVENIRREREFLDGVYARSIYNLIFKEPFILPTEQEIITGSFGNTRTYSDGYESVHNGLDFRAPEGSDIYSINRGVVAAARETYFCGNTVVINHGLDIFSIYCHLREILVSEGEMIERGNLVGRSGSTGLSTGPHLHFGIKNLNDFVDPMQFIKLINDNLVFFSEKEL